MARPIIYLVPAPLHEDSLQTIPPYVLEAVKDCRMFFVENERSARRYLKAIWKEMVIDDYKWIPIHKAEKSVINQLKQCIERGENAAIISEAGCPGIADPGQILAGAAHRYGAILKPLVGPNSILLALMASGMNGQQFWFSGYLPIDSGEKLKAIRKLEEESAKMNCTQVFIETPYRNNPLLEMLIRNCRPSTLLCVAANLTAADESIVTRSIADWRKEKPDYHKKPAIFCLLAEPVLSARG